ncbi:MAG: hypothetical protein HQ525_07480 [Anaerolineae bacterium]|nr:hypothetical protein [Anaerolineae bacterium]
MEENIISNEDNLESGETRKTENQELDDATNEPRSLVEKNENYEQAEAIQNALETLVDNEKVDPSQLEYDPGPVQQPPDWDHGPPKDEVDLGDENTVLGRQPKLREDLSDLEPAGSDDDEKVEATPINTPGPVPGAEATPINTPSPTAQTEDNSLLGRQSSARDDLDQVTENEESGKGDEATPINLPGPAVAEAPEPGPHPFPNVAIEDDGTGGRMNKVGLSPDDVKNVAFGDKEGNNISGHKEPGDPPPPPDMSGLTALSPDDVKLEGGQSTYQSISDEAISVKNEEEGLASQAKVRGDLDDLSSQNSEDEKDEATPINLPGPQPGRVSDEPDHGPNPYTNEGAASGADEVAKDHPGTGGNVAQMPDLEPEPKGKDVADLPIPLFNAPDFEAMNTSERAVVDVIGKAITDKEYRTMLFADVKGAVAGYEMADEDQTALGEMTNEAFDFFATEVDTRFGETKVDIPEAEHQSLLAQVVHAVWRDLNPGSLTYVLAYKIPQKHL